MTAAADCNAPDWSMSQYVVPPVKNLHPSVQSVVRTVLPPVIIMISDGAVEDGIDDVVVDTLTLSAITGQLSLQMGNVGKLIHLRCCRSINTLEQEARLLGEELQ